MRLVFLVLSLLVVVGLAACQAPAGGAPAPEVVTATPGAPLIPSATTPPLTPSVQAAPTSPTPAAPPFGRTLALAEQRQAGDDVRLVQQRLAELGYTQVGPADGVFGPATEAAVRAFQQQQGIDVDGIVGPDTWGRLFSASAVAVLHPIIIAGPNWLLGAADATGWVSGRAAAGRLVGGEQYQIPDAASATGALPEPIETICPDTFTVALSPAPAARRTIAVAGAWPLAPRQPVAVDPAAYEQAVARVLQANGIAQPEVQITGAVQIDLDNDGTSETLISASRLRDPALLPGVAAGDYALIMVQRASGEQDTLIEVVGEYYPVAEELRAPLAHELLGVYDLNGDGALEVVVFSRYYEGASAAAYVIADTTAEQVLATGCGV